MKNIFTIFLISIVSTACYSQNNKNHQSNNVRGAVVTWLFPGFKQDENTKQWQVIGFDTLSVKLFCYNDMVLYQQHTEKYSVNYLNDSLIKQGTIPHIYNIVFLNDSDKALLFENTDMVKGKVLKKDSLLDEQPGLTINVDNILDSNLHEMVSSTKIDTWDVEERYSLNSQNDTTVIASMTLTFSKRKLKDFSYSFFGKEIEQKKGMKLVKVVMNTQKRIITPGNEYTFKLEMPSWVEEIKVENPEELRKIFDKAKGFL